MKLLEDLMEASAKLADQAVKVAGEALETSKVIAGEAMDKGKKKVNELSLETDLSKAQKQLGSLYYVMHKTNEYNQELLDQYCKDIAEIEAKIDELKAAGLSEADDYSLHADGEQAEDEYSMGDFAEDVKSAVSDAVDTVKDGVEDMMDKVNSVKEEKDVKVCPECGAQAEETDIYCKECGAKID